MTSPLIDPRQLRFVSEELWPLSSLLSYPRFAAHGLDTFQSVIDLSHRLALEKFAPHNRASDLNEPHLRDGRVQIIPEVKLALDAYAEAGFTALLADEAEGGLQLPYTLALFSDAMFLSANVATTGYALLARGVANLLRACGSPEQQRLYRQPILEGRFLGTMCLSEPQAGSSLSDIGTRAEPAADGSYRLIGQKMWISGGDHELSENIVHLVLAKIPGGPAGVKGISLFVVPKFLVNDDGSLGARNDVQLAGINHKMGHRGIINTFLKFGESGAVRRLSGGRAAPGPDPDVPHDERSAHRRRHGRDHARHGGLPVFAGIRKGTPPGPASGTEGSVVQTGGVDRACRRQAHAAPAKMLLRRRVRAGDPCRQPDRRAGPGQRSAKRREAMLKLELLTPVIKAWSGEWCTKANDLAIQVLGGYGYTRDYPVEQY